MSIRGSVATLPTARPLSLSMRYASTSASAEVMGCSEKAIAITTPTHFSGSNQCINVYKVRRGVTIADGWDSITVPA